MKYRSETAFTPRQRNFRVRKLQCDILCRTEVNPELLRSPVLLRIWRSCSIHKANSVNNENRISRFFLISFFSYSISSLFRFIFSYLYSAYVTAYVSVLNRFLPSSFLPQSTSFLFIYLILLNPFFYMELKLNLVLVENTVVVELVKKVCDTCELLLTAWNTRCRPLV